jgi:hypothetical protein
MASLARATRIVESQPSQVEKGLIPAPSAKARARALDVKKKQNTKVSQLEHQFMLIELKELKHYIQ